MTPSMMARIERLIADLREAEDEIAALRRLAIAILLVSFFALLVSLAGCGGGGDFPPDVATPRVSCAQPGVCA